MYSYLERIEYGARNSIKGLLIYVQKTKYKFKKSNNKTKRSEFSNMPAINSGRIYKAIAQYQRKIHF